MHIAIHYFKKSVAWHNILILAIVDFHEKMNPTAVELLLQCTIFLEDVSLVQKWTVGMNFDWVGNVTVTTFLLPYTQVLW